MLRCLLCCFLRWVGGEFCWVCGGCCCFWLGLFFDVMECFGCVFYVEVDDGCCE